MQNSFKNFGLMQEDSKLINQLTELTCISFPTWLFVEEEEKNASELVGELL